MAEVYFKLSCHRYGYNVPTALTLKRSSLFPTECICVFRISLQKIRIITFDRFHRLSFVMLMQCVYCEKELSLSKIFTGIPCSNG